ncbi:class I SAM-dependent methyltransferase [Ramlibacter rhizophilus]|uniref:class I SAM-dependent methyltransferase n=1 Tax=Ramlibacter rhizophilus TaxID=1781167 RepID=UPI003B8386D5
MHEARQFAVRYPAVRTVQYQGGDFPFADGEFDVCWSTAVLEHVGDRDRQLHFIRELNGWADGHSSPLPIGIFPSKSIRTHLSFTASRNDSSTGTCTRLGKLGQLADT